MTHMLIGRTSDDKNGTGEPTAGYLVSPTRAKVYAENEIRTPEAKALHVVHKIGDLQS
jgi:hypothetical protein